MIPRPSFLVVAAFVGSFSIVSGLLCILTYTVVEVAAYGFQDLVIKSIAASIVVSWLSCSERDQLSRCGNT